MDTMARTFFWNFMAFYVLKMLKKKFDNITIFRQNFTHEWVSEGNFFKLFLYEKQGNLSINKCLKHCYKWEKQQIY